MDGSRFDALTRHFSSRRTALGGLLIGLLLPLEALARGKGKQRKHKGKANGKAQHPRKGKRKERNKVAGKVKARDNGKPQAQAEICWRSGACIPKKGANVSQCNLAGYAPSTTLDCSGCNLSRANLRGAKLQGANFTKANLSGACLIDADFTGATFANNTNLYNAIFCNTTMPDGSVNNSGCQGGTACCPSGVTCGTSGVCAPTSSQPDCCGSVCTSVKSDLNNCGICNSACNSQTANQCVDGLCKCGSSNPCASGQTCCNGQCQNLSNDVNNCNACDNGCPGTGLTTTDVACQSGTCAMSCRGQNYDVNKNPADGCERADTQTNHTEATALSLGSSGCSDGASAGSFSGTIYSDNRFHSPVPAGFVAQIGAAPLWFKVFAEGGTFCVNDLLVNLTMTGGTNLCYQLTVRTNRRTESVRVTNGSATIEIDTDAYGGGDFVYFKVEKVCALPIQEEASFSATYHL